MGKHDFDLFVIGAGSGGIRAARIAAGHGARVAVAEADHIGGTCVNVGCVPKKLFANAAQFANEFRNARGYGWQADQPRFNWDRLLQNKNQEILRLNRIYEQRLNDSGVKLIYGKASLLDTHTVSVNDTIHSAEKILIATGGRPVIPSIPGSEHAITSNEAFFLQQLPGRIVIVGGGYIGTEFAGIFNGLGCATTLAHRDHYILRGFDDETRRVLSDEISKKGVMLARESVVTAITKRDGQLLVQLENNQQLEADLVMFATGRKPNTSGLGLEQIGVKLDQNGAIIVDQEFRSSVPAIHAIGDVSNKYNLTPVAIVEGAAFASNIFGKQPAIVNYQNIPTCIFSQPNLGTVGLTEEQARKQFNEIAIYKSRFTPLKQSLTDSNEKCFIKLITEKASDRVIGAHMIGADAGEIIQGIAIAMTAGATKAQFDATIGIHPTVAEEFVTLT